MRSFASYSNLVEIGRGGMARVYRANTPTGHLVALKILSLHLANDKSALLRFQQESNLGLDHPNIVRVIESGVDKERGEPYIVMDYVPSESLEQRITRVKQVSPAELARIITDVARALDYAHEKGIIHRDVKPGNILLRASNDQALLTDFGIAKTPFATAYTATIARVGSVLYMSPEQAAGAPTLTRASDIYSLAVTAYYALSGRHPFESTDPIVVARQHIDTPPRHVCEINPSIPRAVGDVVMQGLQKLPHQRPPSAGRFARILAEAVQAKPGRDPMKRTTATLRVPPAGLGAPSAFPSATTPMASSRTVPIPPAYSADGDTGMTSGNFGAGAYDPAAMTPPQMGRRNWIYWAVGSAAVIAAVAGIVAFADNSRDVTPTPPAPTLAAINPSATLPGVGAGVGGGNTATAQPTLGSTTASTVVPTPVTFVVPTLRVPATRPPKPVPPPVPSFTRAPTLPPQPTATTSGVFVPTFTPTASATTVVVTTAPPPPSPTPTNTVPPSDTPVPSDTPPPSNTPLPSDTPAPTDTAEPTAIPTITDTPFPSDTPVPTPTETPT